MCTRTRREVLGGVLKRLCWLHRWLIEDNRGSSLSFKSQKYWEKHPTAPLLHIKPIGWSHRQSSVGKDVSTSDLRTWFKPISVRRNSKTFQSPVWKVTSTCAVPISIYIFCIAIIFSFFFSFLGTNPCLLNVGIVVQFGTRSSSSGNDSANLVMRLPTIGDILWRSDERSRVWNTEDIPHVVPTQLTSETLILLSLFICLPHVILPPAWLLMGWKKQVFFSFCNACRILNFSLIWVTNFF